MGTPLADAIDHLLGMMPDDLIPAWVGGEMASIDEAATRDPAGLADALLVAVDAASDPDAALMRVMTVVGLLPDGERDAVLRQAAGHGVVMAGRMTAEAPWLDWAAIVPPAILARAVAGPRSGDSWGWRDVEWAVEIVRSATRDWDWPLLARVLDASASCAAAPEWLAEALRELAWARKDPDPSTDAPLAGRVPTLVHELAAIPYDQLFSAGDARVVAAASQAAAVVECATGWRSDGRDPGPWLVMLGRALPGCGEQWCCREGLFEAALRRAGYALRSGRFPVA